MKRWGGRLLAVSLLLEAGVASYLAIFDTASIVYYALVVAHVLLGVPLLIGLALWVPAAWREGMRRLDAPRVLCGVTAAGAIGTALALTITGTARPWRVLLLSHIGCSVVALGFALFLFYRQVGGARAHAAAAFGLLALLAPVASSLRERYFPVTTSRIENPTRPPLSMDGEGGGPGGPFFPSSNLVAGSDLVPADFFLESRSCGNAGCHVDIVAQWDSSAHHRSSFNNQWYRKSVEYMQEVVGTKPSKWCGGCHDMAVLLTGRMDRPIVEQIDTPESQAGIGCLVCHSITRVHDTMGNGGFTLTYPEMHKLVAAKKPGLNRLHDTMVHLDPAPHRRTMLQPFHREQTARFCSACHKVHLDVPVNAYRWFRGFNEYDAWQNSGISGGNARAFYYPPAPKKCADCHMPLVPSRDPGNIDGFVHSHRFPAANTALAVAYKDETQLEITERFMKADILSIDIFGLSRPDPSVRASRREETSAAGRGAQAPPETAAPALATLSADEGDVVSSRGPAAEPRRMTAPLGGEASATEAEGAVLRPGETLRVEVVARTRGIGHTFPGGTMDAFDTWIEFHAADATGRTIAWSGSVAEAGRGPVDPSAHFYKSLLLDARGNSINKRNAWAARAVVYTRAIPPGAADTMHYELSVPHDVVGPVTLTARINYRKFSDFYNRFSYLGQRSRPVTPAEVTPDFDDVPFAFTGDPSQASGHVKELPEIPIIVMAEDRITLPVEGAAGGAPADKPALVAEVLRPAGSIPPGKAPEKVRERFNDYGIGLLRQGDLRGAAAAFEKVTTVEPSYADGWVNRGRVGVQEGRHREARGWLARALTLNPNLSSAHFFMAMTLKSEGRYDEALEHLRAARARFPEDREVSNQIGRLLYLKRDFRGAVEAFHDTLRVDPEDLTAHYNLMLCFRGLGKTEEAAIEETIYLRFKADEASQAIAGPYLRAHLDDNRERQAIHEHPTRPASEIGALWPGGEPTRISAGAGAAP